MKSYGTGLGGFIGKELVKQLDDVTAIPHEKIQTTVLKPFDFFYYLSSYGNLVSQTDDAKIYKANITDLLSVLLQIKDIPFKSFVYLSSSSVMLKTHTTYSRCKRAAEQILLAFLEKYNLPICIIRPFSVTGIGEQREHLIPTLIEGAMTGKTVNLVPDATHDFIDVSDVVSGIFSLSNNRARGVYQMGTGVKTKNSEVLGLVEKAAGKKIAVNYVETLRPYDNTDWVSTNFKARGYGWLPRISLEESIKRMVENYKEIEKYSKME